MERNLVRVKNLDERREREAVENRLGGKRPSKKSGAATKSKKPSTNVEKGNH